MAVTVSLINMKGGVGKTTLAAQLAHVADQHKLRTLAVDLDPQANLSQSLLSPERYIKVLSENKPTVVALLDDYAPALHGNIGPRPVEVHDTILKKVGYWKNTSLDLIPGRLELSRLLKNPTGKERRLARALSKVANDYELILIDCAPTESILTDVAYFASRYALVPVKPEFLATIGLPLLARSIQGFKHENPDHELDICGIVFNHSSSYSQGPEGSASTKEVQKEATKHEWHTYETHIRYSSSYAKAAREGTPIDKTSYTREEAKAEFNQFFWEFIQSVGFRRASS